MKFSNILIGLLVLIILWLALCHKKDVVIPDDTRPDQVRVMDLTEEQAQKIRDSIRKYEVAPAQQESEFWENRFINKKQTVINTGTSLGDLIDKECPDTTGKIKAKLAELLAENASKDSACENTIAAQKKVSAGLEKIIKEDSLSDITKRGLFDKAIDEQGKLLTALRKTQPRNQIYAGATIIGNHSNILGGYGVNLGLKTKKGVMVEVGTLYFNEVNQFTLGLKKVISFRK